MNQHSSFQVYNASAGSGKTFALVKEYLKVLLLAKSDFVFQNILAITFTNKAAAEMKERVLGNLREFSEGVENDMFIIISKENGFSKKEIQTKSKRVLENILQNYSAFNIATIDSFTHRLIRNFAHDLGLPMSFEVEMDPSKLLNEAVDVLISKIGSDKALTDVLVSFSLQKVADDKAWDISRELNNIAKIVLNDDDIEHIENLNFDTIDQFIEVEKILLKKKEEIEDLFEENGKKGLAIIDAAGISYKSFVYGELPKHFIKFTQLSGSTYELIKYDGRLQKNINENVYYSKSTKADVKKSIDAIVQELIEVYDEGRVIYDQYFGVYVLIDMVLKGLVPLALLSNIRKEIEEIKVQNAICLSSEFNTIISNKIKNEPAPFIYERIGEKFKHFFIDEMQDTSYLQWQNLIPLIENSLSQQDGSLMLVGDAKQAIYRWRGGRAEQFVNLSSEKNELAYNPFFVDKKLENLSVNYRSFSEVINFNNAFFSHIASFLENDIYRDLYVTGNQQELNKNIGGYVQLDFIDVKALEKEEKALAFPKKVLEIIEGLDPAFSKKDVCVIVRTNKDGVAVANHLVENGIHIVSSETLLVKNSLKVSFIVDLLTYIQNPQDLDAKFSVLVFLEKMIETELSSHQFYAQLLNLKIDDFFNKLKEFNINFEKQLFLQLPFYASIEYLIRSFNLLTSADAYVQFFLDFILEFQRKNYVVLSSFLSLWEEKKDKLSISAVEADNAVKIMTIHKSKGLEFPVVIFPCDVDVTKEIEPTVWYNDLDNSVFGNLGSSLVSCSKKISYAGEKGFSLYQKRQQELVLDNFNLLYVVLTRAVEQLYVVTDLQIDSKGVERTNHFSGLFINFLKDQIPNFMVKDNLEYHFGNKMRLVKSKPKEQLAVNSLQEKFISTTWNSHDISIVANSSKNWGDSSHDSRNYGLLIHEMLSKIIYEEDVEKVVESYIGSGEIELKNQQKTLSMLKKVVFHKELNQYFKREYKIISEREILDTDKSILIPDRLIQNSNNVVIIEYKTGERRKSYEIQINKYAAILEKMSYKIVAKCIVYLGEDVNVEFIL